jgi:hypothetical protein
VSSSKHPLNNTAAKVAAKNITNTPIINLFSPFSIVANNNVRNT